MAISMSLLMITDDQIRDFSENPSRLEHLLTTEIPYSTERVCYLADFWDGIHYVLTGKAESGKFPLCVLKRGEVEYFVDSDPTHAVYSSTARAFTFQLQGLSASKLRERFDTRKMCEACVYPVRLWAFPELADRTFDEMMFYFDRLRAFTTEAEQKNMGLLSRRYEE